MRLERFTVEVPSTPGGVAALLARLLVDCRCDRAFAVSNAQGRQLRKTCALCGKAVWTKGRTALSCDRDRHGRTPGIAVPCPAWEPCPGILVLDEDTGHVFLASKQDE